MIYDFFKPLHDIFQFFVLNFSDDYDELRLGIAISVFLFSDSTLYHGRLGRIDMINHVIK